MVRRFPQIGEGGGVVEFRLEFRGGELIGDVQDHSDGGSFERADMLDKLGAEKRRLLGIVEHGLGKQGTLAPFVYGALEKKGSDRHAVDADVQLEIEIHRLLVPCGQGRATGLTQKGASLAVLLEKIQRCGMFEIGQESEGGKLS